MSKKDDRSSKTEVQGLDPVIKEGMANYFRGFTSVGGKMLMTARTLTFKPHALNWRRGEESWALKDVVAVAKRNTAIVVPNGLSIMMRDGSEARFSVYGRDEWVTAIVDACSAIHPPKKMPGAEAKK